MSNISASELEQLRDAGRDPVVTDGDKDKVILENDRVRVLVSPGQVAWGKAQSHVGENVGATDTHVLVIELN